jgi:Flp pilus assembly secretin CpaC
VAICFLPGIALFAAEDEQRLSIIVGTHERIVLDEDALRVAVGDPDLLSVETLTTRELLVLGRDVGQTTLIVWYREGATRTIRCFIRPDLSLLEQALRGIHASITVDMAPDREAVILSGRVPDISYSNAAEATALEYLGVLSRGSRAAPPVKAGDGDAATSAPPAGAPPFKTTGEVRASATVINLIKVERLPEPLEVRMASAVREALNVDIHVRRVFRGDLPDDLLDVFVLSGQVPDQAALTRALHLASALLLGRSGGRTSIEVIGDESGGLRSEGRDGSASTGRGGVSGDANLSGGGGRSDNELDVNVGRASVLSTADGRILSFLNVRDLPQVRIDVRFYEVNRSLLDAYSSDLTAIYADFAQTPLLAASGSERVMGSSAARAGGRSDPDIQDVLGYLAGETKNQFQLSGSRFAIDSVLSVLEKRGVARALSRPSLTVLSGETATFQVGGEIPVTESFAPTTESGVFNTVSFRSYGVQLQVRPLVGSDGAITMDLVPQVSLPDTVLTSEIRESTGTATGSTAFETRYLETTARLEDSESLIVGGLVSRSTTLNVGQTPGIGQIPVLGWLFGSYDRSREMSDLVIVVRPIVLRERNPLAGLWAHPSPRDLVRNGAVNSPGEKSGAAGPEGPGAPSR